MIQPTKSQTEAIKLYTGIMEEVKIRVQWVADAVSDKYGMDGQLVRELSYLQFRLICELIALGCLVAHGDVTASTKLVNEFAADKICTELEKLHPNFYPKPHNQVLQGAGRFHLDDVTEPFLTRADLKTLYVKTGSILHKGKLKGLLKAQSPVLKDFNEIKEWRNKIVRLLSIHRLPLADGDSHILCVLTDTYTKQVDVHFASKVDELGDGIDEIELL
ncbi:hypothetical protein ASD89_10240 [Caulobacter sp. Root656]|nr:hypothetical protein ASD89_10240 [Caulobacter sp. Root656]